MNPSAIEVVRVHDSPDFSYGRIGRFLVIRWWRPITVSSMEAMGRVTGRELATSPGDRFVVIPVVDRSVKRPEPGAAAALDLVMQTYEHRVDGVANVILGTGFHSAMLRAIITGMTFARRPRHPVRICATIGEAVASFGAVPHAAAATAAIERFALAAPPSAGGETG